MPQFINTNIASLNSQRNLNQSQGALQTSLQRLSSGMRVNSAKDDAAGMAIASRMESQIRGLNQAARNANDGISLAQTAEGALASIQSNLQRMRELAVQAGNATSASSTDMAAINNEFLQLAQENDRVIDATSFNGQQLFPIAGITLTFQVGADTNAAANGPNLISIDTTTTPVTLTSSYNNPAAPSGAIATAYPAAAAMTMGATGGLVDQATAQTAILNLDADIATIAGQRSTFGAVQSRFESIISNLQIASENTSASKSRIMDADYAAETAALTRAQILQQAGTAMLAQANQSPNTVLTLLR
ncbi:MAG: flagellin [Gallionellaceae bacterium]|jgi:flagellin